jgi:hypothetical protein
MKKFALATLIALSVSTASALEVGVTGARDFGSDRNTAGLTVGEKFGPFGVTLGFDRSVTTADSQNRWTLVGSYPVYKFGPVALSAKAGAAYLDNSTGYDGGAAIVGVGAEMPVFDKVKATFDLTHQHGQARVSQFNGNRATVGLKYSF